MKQVSQHDAISAQTPGANTSAEEALSALMDGELDEFGLRRLLARIQERPDLLATWERFNLVRAAFQPEPLDFRSMATRENILQPDALSQRIMAAVSAEPSTAAGVVKSSDKNTLWTGALLKMAVAASVAVAVFVGMQSLLDQPAAPQLAELQTQQQLNEQPASSMQDSAMQIAVDAEAQQRLNDYIRSVSIPGRSEAVGQPYNILLESPMLRPVSDRELVEEVQRTSP